MQQPPDWYPTIDRQAIRDHGEIVDRALVLNVVVNCAYAMPIDAARSWLSNNGLSQAVTPFETNFLREVEHGADPAGAGYQLHVERLWVLAWSLLLTETIRWNRYCGDELASWLPDLRSNEDTKRFRARASTGRTEEEVLSEVDAAFCLTWACVQANLQQNPIASNVDPYVFWERRMALEWLRGDDWDEPSLDT